MRPSPWICMPCALDNCESAPSRITTLWWLGSPAPAGIRSAALLASTYCKGLSHDPLCRVRMLIPPRDAPLSAQDTATVTSSAELAQVPAPALLSPPLPGAKNRYRRKQRQRKVLWWRQTKADWTYQEGDRNGKENPMRRRQWKHLICIQYMHTPAQGYTSTSVPK